MTIPLPLIGFFVFAITAGYAQFVTPDAVDWEKVRAAQPEGLSLKLEVPKAFLSF